MTALTDSMASNASQKICAFTRRIYWILVSRVLTAPRNFRDYYN